MVLTSFSLLGSFSCYSFWLLVQAQRSLHHLPWGGLWLVGGTPQSLVCSHVPLSFQEKERGTNLWPFACTLASPRNISLQLVSI